MPSCCSVFNSPAADVMSQDKEKANKCERVFSGFVTCNGICEFSHAAGFCGEIKRIVGRHRCVLYIKHVYLTVTAVRNYFAELNWIYLCI